MIYPRAYQHPDEADLHRAFAPRGCAPIEMATKTLPDKSFESIAAMVI